MPETMHGLKAWIKKAPVLQKPVSSRIHSLAEAFREGRVFGHRVKDEHLSDHDIFLIWDNWIKKAPVFLVQHDWAAAFAGAEDFAGSAEYQLPYPDCAFEFQITGVRVIFMVGDSEHNICAVESTDGWLVFGVLMDSPEPFLGYAVRQIRALCIALDADVAETEIQRAPHKLNKAREKARRPLLKDYHLVSLARKHRTVRLESSGEPGTRKRLHFRRGRWRHYATFKTWIKWCLVGDPDLGFIDKDYLA